jgi:XTP/dITP diphosphohydrolase
MKLVFATSNPHKVHEFKSIVGDSIDVHSLMDINWDQPIEETADTLEGNAILKARTIAEALEVNCFSEDTGLEIDALDGKPGVYSARYAGPDNNPEKNMQKVLEELSGVENRSARFRTVMALIIDDELHCFHGVVEGEIIHEPKGDGGFGYDPIFRPDGHETTFAEMTTEQKGVISHRARATQALTAFLAEYIKCKNRELRSLQKQG